MLTQKSPPTPSQVKIRGWIKLAGWVEDAIEENKNHRHMMANLIHSIHIHSCQAFDFFWVFLVRYVHRKLPPTCTLSHAKACCYITVCVFNSWGGWVQQDKTRPDKLKSMQHIAHRSELGGICVCLCVSAFLRHSRPILQEVVSVKKKKKGACL